MDNRKLLLHQICGCDDIPKYFENCTGRLGTRCQKLNGCVFNCFSDEQIEYIVSDVSSNVYLDACPGSGKTEVVGIKGAYEIQNWQQNHSGIAVLTFTNSAENEIKLRTEEYLGHQIQHPHFVGTFASWLHGYIANPFLHIITKYCNKKTFDNSIRIIDSDCMNDFLCAFQTKYTFESCGKIKANRYYYELKEQKYIYLDKSKKEEFNALILRDKWRNKCLEETKNKFWATGFATYEDIEFLSYQLLTQNSQIAACVAKRFPLLLIDECQDLSYIELEILNCLNSFGMRIHLIGDLNQSIYGFRNIEPNDTRKFINELSMRHMLLTQNHRSCNAIVSASKAVLCSNDEALGTRNQTVDKPLIAILYKSNEENKVIEIFESLIAQNKLSIEMSRIIVRNNSLKNKLYGGKNKYTTINIIEEFARFIFLYDMENSVESFQTSVQCLARAIQKAYFGDAVHDNSIKLFKPDPINSDSWRKIICAVKKDLISYTGLHNIELTWSEWKKQLSKALKDELTLDGNKYILKLGNIRKGCSTKKVCDELGSSIEHTFNCRIETIHSCKGMSLDAVLFMSTYSKRSESETENNGSYWHSWFVENSEAVNESNRLAYVAFSRAKQLLVLGIPNPNSSPIDEEHKELLIDAGFEIITI